jgi:hypothetical protein
VRGAFTSFICLIMMDFWLNDHVNSYLAKNPEMAETLRASMKKTPAFTEDLV